MSKRPVTEEALLAAGTAPPNQGLVRALNQMQRANGTLQSAVSRYEAFNRELRKAQSENRWWTPLGK